MKYYLLLPDKVNQPWPVERAVLNCKLKCGLNLFYCEGPEPLGVATGFKAGGPKGEVAWWPIFSTPPKEVYLLLAEIDMTDSSPATGEEDGQ